ncbi:hypothetical protein evm_010407 [Chilo suppressalis]|nr:hypothetical protein evm_010407 [Chilo suppressalis]
MTVTVVVSGLPHHVPLADIAYHFDKLLNTDEVGTFRLREIWDGSNDSNVLALDFRSGFDAMHVQMLLDGVKLTLENGKNYKIKCKISNDKMHAYTPAIEYEDTSSRIMAKYESSSSSLISLNDHKMRKECSSLDTYLTLLQKKKKVVDAERELLIAKKKLKREHTMEETDSEDEDSSYRRKYSKVSKSRDYRSRRSSSREPTPLTSRESIQAHRRSSARKTRSRSRSRRSSIKSPSPSKGHSLNFKKSPSRKMMVYMSSKSYYDRDLSPSTSETNYRSASSARRSRSLSRKRSSPSFKKSSRYDRSPSSLETPPKHDRSPPSFRKSPSRSRMSYYERKSSSRKSYKRESPCSYSTSKNERASASSSNVKYYKDDEYTERNNEKCAKNHNATSNNGDSTIEHAVIQQILIEMDDLLENEKKSLSKNEINMVITVFKDHVTSGFGKLRKNIYRNMSIEEAVDIYRLHHSKDEDKEFILKMTRELKSIDTKNSIDTKICINNTENSTEVVDLTKANDIWDDIKEVLEDIPIEMLQCNDRINTPTDECTELINNVTEEVKEKLSPKNPTFIIPVKKLMAKMKTHLSKFNSDPDCKDLHDITKKYLRERISNILIGKELMKTAQIIELYRSVYPQEDDEMFLKDIVDNIKNGKYNDEKLQEERKEDIAQ